MFSLTTNSPARPVGTKLTRTKLTRTRVFAAIAAFGLLASACGGSGDDGLAADADSAGVARSFCDSVADLGATIQSSSPTTDQAAAAAATMELMPADAPAFATDYFQAIADTTQLQAAGADSSIAEAAWANGQHLQVSAFLGATCPDSSFTSSATFQGMIAMGMEMQASGTLGSDDTASASPTTTVAEAATQDEDDAGNTAAPTTSAGLNRILLGEGEASGIYAQVEWTIGEIYSSNATRSTLFTDEAEPGNNEFWALVEVDGETQANIRASYSKDEFFLTSPEGLTMNGEIMVDRFGENIYGGVDFDGQENKSAFVLFATPEQITNIDGWTLSVKAGNQIPLILPLAGPADAVETNIALPAVETFGVRGDTTWDECSSTYDLTILDTALTIESSYNNSIRRSNEGERFLVISYDIQNTTEDVSGFPCISSAAGNFDPEYLRLSIDGRVSTPEALEHDRIEEGSTIAGQAVYIVPAEATELTLLGETFEEVYTTWQVDIPALPGE